MSRIYDALRRIGVPSHRATTAEQMAAHGPMLEQYETEPGTPDTEVLSASSHGPHLAVAHPHRPAHRDTARQPRIVPAAVAATPAAAPPAPPVARAAGSGSPVPTDADKLVDFHALADYVGFVLRSIRRRKLIVVSVAAFMLAATLLAVHYWPRSYRVETVLLAQRNDVMAALVNPTRAIPRDAEAPTRAASETVLRQENLVSLIRQTDLLNEWERTRAPVLKLKDRVWAMFWRRPTESEKLDGLVGLLEQRLTVMPGPEGTVTIALTWPDGRVAQELVSAALQSFLDARQNAETAAIAESISILERSEEGLRADVNRTIGELEQTRSARVARSADRPRPAAPALAAPLAPTVAQPSPEQLARTTSLKNSLDTKRMALARMDESRRQQLADAESRLAAARTIYTEGHPAIASLRQNVAMLSRETPEVQALRAEVQNLEDEYESALSAPRDSPSSVAAATPVPATGVAVAARGGGGAVTASGRALDVAVTPPSVMDVGPDTINPTALRLRVELSELATVRERTNAARSELATSQAGFKFRYNIIRPPVIPRKPSAPNVPAVVAAGVLASLILGIAAAVMADVLSGRVLETWQVKHFTGLPVLGTLRTP